MRKKMNLQPFRSLIKPRSKKATEAENESPLKFGNPALWAAILAADKHFKKVNRDLRRAQKKR